MTLDIFPVPARDVEGSLRAEAGRIPFRPQRPERCSAILVSGAYRL